MVFCNNGVHHWKSVNTFLISKLKEKWAQTVKKGLINYKTNKISIPNEYMSSRRTRTFKIQYFIHFYFSFTGRI
jgi:hypothetical protein